MVLSGPDLGGPGGHGATTERLSPNRLFLDNDRWLRDYDLFVTHC